MVVCSPRGGPKFRGLEEGEQHNQISITSVLFSLIRETNTSEDYLRGEERRFGGSVSSTCQK